MLHIALCDDEPIWLEKMAHYFASRQDLAITTTRYSDGEALVRDCRAQLQHFDAVFLDMEMLGLSGIDTAQALREMGSDVVIVFVTSHSEYAIDGYDYGAFGYLLKSSLDQKLPGLTDRLIEKLNEQSGTIVVKTTQGEVVLKREDIVYCEKSRHYVIVHTQTADHQARLSLNDFEASLQSPLFVRTHRGFLVNLMYVKRIREKNVVMKDETLNIPVGREYKEELRKAWNLYLRKEAGL